MNFYFIFEFRNCLDLFSVSIGLSRSISQLAQAKHVTPAFNSKWKYEKLVAVVRVLQNTENSCPVQAYADIFESATFSFRIQIFPRPHVAKISGVAAELAGGVWTEAVSGKKKLPIQIYPDTCGWALVISRCCFVEHGKELHKDKWRTCTVIAITHVHSCCSAH